MRHVFLSQMSHCDIYRPSVSHSRVNLSSLLPFVFEKENICIISHVLHVVITWDWESQLICTQQSCTTVSWITHLALFLNLVVCFYIQVLINITATTLRHPQHAQNPPSAQHFATLQCNGWTVRIMWPQNLHTSNQHHSGNHLNILHQKTYFF